MPRSESATERRAAFEAMFRVRAVESPPDALGLRTVWHRPYDDVQLVSTIDASGQVKQHELVMFDDVVRWEREHGVRTAVKKEGRVDDDVSVDALRLERAITGLTSYTGDDRLITHLRELLVPAKPLPLRTRTRKIARPNKRRIVVSVLLVLSLLALAAALVFASRVIE
ncbi:MAG: hypothetical protein JNG84_09000 [Archangium sp.]|nr:hypothetical protein [Archangium sp.]